MRKRFRLRTDAEFRRVRGAGRSWANPLLVLYALPNDQDVTRVGFAVGKRIGNAVARNRVKRRLREAVRLHFPVIAAGFDLILIARAPIATAGFRDVAAAVESLLRRSRLISSVDASGVGEGPAAGRSEQEPRGA